VAAARTGRARDGPGRVDLDRRRIATRARDAAGAIHGASTREADMRSATRIVMAAAVAASVAGGATAANVPWEQRSAVERVWYTAGAVVANLTPVSALYAPRCLPGYLLCKLSFAGASVLAAADQLVFSGGADLAQTRAILYRGFAGDWVLTPRPVAGEAKPEPLPEPPPPGADRKSVV